MLQGLHGQNQAMAEDDSASHLEIDTPAKASSVECSAPKRASLSGGDAAHANGKTSASRLGARAGAPGAFGKSASMNKFAQDQQLLAQLRGDQPNAPCPLAAQRACGP